MLDVNVLDVPMIGKKHVYIMSWNYNKHMEYGGWKNVKFFTINIFSSYHDKV